MIKNSDLALFGGPALAGDIVKPQWPPRSAATRERLIELYDSGDWAFGMATDLDRFSWEFAEMHGCAHGIFMVNGTVTLQCALMAAGVGPGDEVIVPAYTWLATATAVRHAGAKIVFADVERSTLCLDPAAVEAAVTPRTRAIIPVHFMGSAADMDALMDIAGRHNLIVIEDCAQAHGTKWDGKPVGSIGHIGSFSFQHNKIMSCGEGGICVTNDHALATRLYQSAYIGYAPGEKFGAFKTAPPSDLLCYNFRGTQFQAVLLYDQLKGLEERVALYSDHAELLRSRIDRIEGVRMQARGRKANPQSYYKLCFVFDEEPLAHIPVDRIMQAIQAEGIPVQPSYGAVPGHILFQLPPDDYVLPKGGLPISRSIGADRVIMLSHQWLELSKSELSRIADVIEKVASRANESDGERNAGSTDLSVGAKQQALGPPAASFDRIANEGACWWSGRCVGRAGFRLSYRAGHWRQR